MIHILDIPKWHPTRLNQLLGHWSKPHKRKKADRLIVWQSSLASKIPKATGKRRLTLHIILKKWQRGADPDGYFKSLNDALVHAGLLKNDSKEWVELSPVIYSRGENWGSRIILEDL